MGTISFHHHGISPSLKGKLLLRSFLASVFAREATQFKSVSYVFCTDAYLLKLNQEYLKHDTFTDILTFALSGSSLPIVAEIYISVERVTDNALTLGVEFEEELRRVMIHGILHLCGYKDHSAKQKAEMRSKENFYLSLW